MVQNDRFGGDFLLDFLNYISSREISRMISNNLAFLSNCIIYKLNVRGGIFIELKTLLRRTVVYIITPP